MGYLFKSSGLSDAAQLSASIWFRFLSGGGGSSDLLCISPVELPDTADSGSTSGFFIYTSCGSGSGINIQAASSDCGFNPDGATGSYVRWYQNIAGLSLDAWHHLAVSVDAGSLASAIIIDGLDHSMTGTRYTYAAGPHDIGMNGNAIGIPDLLETDYLNGSAGNQVVALQDYQVWSGKYIDWTNPTNYSKVVKISGSHGTPVDPAIAELAFGRPTLRFTGNHTKFPTNTGTGGAFSLVGTDIDFTPTASYG